MANAKNQLDTEIDAISRGTYRLAALVIQAIHPRSNSTIAGEETILNQCPEVVNTRVAIANRRVATNIGRGRGRVPGVTNGDVGLVERSVDVERVVARESVGRRDGEAVSIGRHAKNNLVGGETGTSPGRNGRDSRTLLIARGGTGVVKRRVGAGDTAKSAEDVVVHDLWNLNKRRERRRERATCQSNRAGRHMRRHRSMDCHWNQPRARCWSQLTG